MDSVIQECRRVYDSTVMDKQSVYRLLGASLGISVLVTWPLWVGNTHYFDDFNRLVEGDPRWTRDGRPLADWLTQLINTSPLITDLSPLPLLAGLVVLNFCLAIALSQWAARQPKLRLQLCVILNPFIAQCLMYTFDSLTILISFALGFLAVLTLHTHWLRQFSISFALSLAALCLYQISLNIIFMSFMLISMLRILESNASTTKTIRLLPQLIAVVTAATFYKTVVMRFTIAGQFHTERSQLVNFDYTGMHDLSSNLINAGAAVLEAFPGYRVIPVVAILALGVLACWSIALGRFKTQKGGLRRYAIVIYCLFAPLTVCLAIAGFPLMLQHQGFYPRLLSAFGPAMLFHASMAYNVFPRLRSLLAVCLFVHLASCTIFMLTTFRAAVHQAHFNEHLLVTMRGDLSRTGAQSIDNIAIIGSSPYSPYIRPTLEAFPFSKKIILTAFWGDFPYVYYTMTRGEMIDYPYRSNSAELERYSPDSLLASNCLYAFYLHERTAVFNFRWSPCTSLLKNDF